jgi:hypothetical protein
LLRRSTLTNPQLMRRVSLKPFVSQPGSRLMPSSLASGRYSSMRCKTALAERERVASITKNPRLTLGAVIIKEPINIVTAPNLDMINHLVTKRTFYFATQADALH